MTSPQQNLSHERAPQGRGVYFGIPLGDLGPLTSLLMALTLGFLSFFLFTFLGILGIAIYNSLGHRVDYSHSYKYFALPGGCVVLVVGLVFFATLWLRRKVSGG